MEHYVCKLYKVYVNDDPQLTLKGTATLMISIVYKKELYKPWFFDSSFIKIGSIMVKLWAFEYLQMGRNGRGHIVVFVTSLSLIRYA